MEKLKYETITTYIFTLFGVCGYFYMLILEDYFRAFEIFSVIVIFLLLIKIQYDQIKAIKLIGEKTKGQWD